MTDVKLCIFQLYAFELISLSWKNSRAQFGFRWILLAPGSFLWTNQGKVLYIDIHMLTNNNLKAYALRSIQASMYCWYNDLHYNTFRLSEIFNSKNLQNCILFPIMLHHVRNCFHHYHHKSMLQETCKIWN